MFTLKALFKNGCIDLVDERLKSHYTAGSGLERLSVLAVHGSEAKEYEIGLGPYDACHSCDAEHLRKMHFLSLVYNVDDLVGMICPFAVYKGRKICCGIKRRAVGFCKDEGRDLLLIGAFRNIYNKSALAFICKPFILNILYHVGYKRLCVALRLPYIKRNAEFVIVFLEIRNGKVKDVMPKSLIASVILLEHKGRKMRTL